MKESYARNYLYISNENQKKLKQYPVLLAGAGLGSNIAESLLRMGFENLTIVDGDVVEESNLNRQNYLKDDIGVKKVEAIHKRLKLINQNASIKRIARFITSENIHEFITDHKVVINAIDFTSDASLVLDDYCISLGIKVIHPYNFGWAGAVTTIDNESYSFRDIRKKDKSFNEIEVVKYFLSYKRYWKEPQPWLEQIVTKYLSKEHCMKAPPQLGVSSCLVAAMCTTIVYKICVGEEIKKFPEFYFTNILE